MLYYRFYNNFNNNVLLQQMAKILKILKRKIIDQTGTGYTRSICKLYLKGHRRANSSDLAPFTQQNLNILALQVGLNANQ